MNRKLFKSVVEALLFVSEEPLTIKRIKEVVQEEELKDTEIKECIDEINQSLLETERSFTITEIAGGYQLKTLADYSPWLSVMFNKQKKERLSRAALETLAIVAYRQPIIRADIEVIRGVDAGGMLGNLLEKHLIKITGRKDIAGRPFIYETTQKFLEYFGLKSLHDLPERHKFQEQMQEKIKKNKIAEEMVARQKAEKEQKVFEYDEQS